MVSEVYEALIEAGASEAKSKAADEAIPGLLRVALHVHRSRERHPGQRRDSRLLEKIDLNRRIHLTILNGLPLLIAFSHRPRKLTCP